MEELEEVKELLGSQIPEDPHQMQKNATLVEAYRFRLAVILAGKKKVLTDQEQFSMLQKSKVLTELDRKMHLEFKTKDMREEVEVYEQAIAGIDKRINLIQSMLKFATEEYRNVTR